LREKNTVPAKKKLKSMDYKTSEQGQQGTLIFKIKQDEQEEA
jgi:hypothetical protein